MFRLWKQWRLVSWWTRTIPGCPHYQERLQHLLRDQGSSSQSRTSKVLVLMERIICTGWNQVAENQCNATELCKFNTETVFCRASVTPNYLLDVHENLSRFKK